MAEREPVAEQMPTPNNTSTPATLTPWAQIRDSLADPQTTTWLATVRPDGRPHVVPVGALWLDGAYYVTTGQGTVKGANLAHNPHCVITLASRGYDVVLEGAAAPVRDGEQLERIARAYAAQGWPATVHDGVFDAPYSAPWTGPGPYDVYMITPSKVLAFSAGEENRGTRYRF